MSLTDTPGSGLFNYARMRATSDAFIKRNGRPAALSRPGAADRPCHAILIAWTQAELMGGLYDPMTRQAIVTAEGLDAAPPVMDLDRLIVFKRGQPGVIDETLKIDKPPVPLRPGDLTLQWSIAVRK